jgi:hypothetical protein
MAGIRLLSHLQMGLESTKGSAVAATRKFYPDLSSTFQVDWMKTYHEGRRTGRRNPVTYATQQGTMVTIGFRSIDDAGIAFDELPFFLNAPDGATAATSGTASYLWDTFAWGGTANGTPRTYTVEYGDDVQNYEAEYCFPTRLGMSADTDGMTQFTADIVGRQSTKSTVTALSPTDPVYIPGFLWVPKFATAQSGLDGASAIPNFLRNWSMDWSTGLMPHKYQDGLSYFGQVVESAPVEGSVRLVVDSNATAITQFYDKAAANTVDFLNLTATGGTVAGGATAYKCDIDVALEYTNVSLLASDIDGVNTYEIEAKIVDDETWGQSIGIEVVNALADLTS